jgi:hypothetical protein
MERLEANLPFLKKLQKVRSKKKRREILKKASLEQVKALCDVCTNILSGCVPLTPSQKTKLSRHAYAIRTLGGSKKTSLRNKRQILIQKGGVLPAILAPLLSIAAGLVSGLVG